MSNIIGLDGMKHLLNLLYHIPFIEGEKAPGVLIVAPPEQGKSFLLTKITSSSCYIVNDITGYGLEKLVLDITAKGENGYIVIPDMEKVVSRKDAFKSFASLANILLEEGLGRIERADVSVKLPRNVNFGIIGAITEDGYAEHYEELKSIGFISRQIILSFSYCKHDNEIIEEQLAKGVQIPQNIIRVTQHYNVSIPERLTPFIRKLAKVLSTVREDKGTKRSINHIRALVKAQTILANRQQDNEYITTSQDLNSVFCLLPFFSNPYKVKTSKPRELFSKLKHRYASDAEYYVLRGIVEDNNPAKYFGDGKKYPSDELITAISNLDAFLQKDEDGQVKIIKL